MASLQSATTESKSQTFLSESLVITLQKWLDRGLTKSGQKSPVGYKCSRPTALHPRARVSHRKTGASPAHDNSPTTRPASDKSTPSQLHITKSSKQASESCDNRQAAFTTALSQHSPNSSPANHNLPFQAPFRTSGLQLLLFGLRVHIYCFPDFGSTFTAFWTLGPHLSLCGLHVQIYCFSVFGSTFIAFRTSGPHLLLSGLRVHIYGFSDLASTSTVFRTSRPHLLLFQISHLHLRLSELRVHIYCFPDFASAFTAFRTSRPHLLLYELRIHI
ncbi:hypothetical protein CRG98_005075 [Punica granatum]|uniref:Uncharacterized protein n=1 Tax=Punica granatum TaxID=22663 RepID=A0A2I0L1M0_PUNGR|nr:hypothetical protein CRG98_005075 [Punica granatum]